jgi:hypothetical protein
MLSAKQQQRPRPTRVDKAVTGSVRAQSGRRGRPLVANAVMDSVGVDAPSAPSTLE